MKVKIFEDGEIKEVKVGKGVSVSRLAKQMGVNLPSHIAKVNNRIVPDDEKLREGDKIEFMRIISGG